MSLVTPLWSGIAAICFTLAGVHLLVWFHNRRSWAHLALCATALGISYFTIVEVVMMLAATPQDWARGLRWIHAPGFVVLVGLMMFVYFYLGTGRRWLLILAISLRFFALVLNFLLTPNINFKEVISIRHVSFLGDTVAILDKAVPSPWTWVAQLSLVLCVAFTLDATLTHWRRGRTGGRYRELIMGGSICLFIMIAATHVLLVLNGVIMGPFIPSFSFLIPMLAMSYELSRDISRAGALARDLRVSEQRLRLAASAARIVLWEWQVDQDSIWASSGAREFVGMPPTPTLSFQQFVTNLHPDDRPRVLEVIRRAVDQLGSFTAEYRRVLPDGKSLWIAGSGSAERDPATGAVLMRGVSIDISARREIEDVTVRQRSELTHMSRVSMMGQLATSLAHELNQPLGAILRNAEAAELFLQSPSPDLVELRAIVEDIRKDDARAGAVIARMRAFLQRHEVESRPVDLNELSTEVVSLVRPDADLRMVRLIFDPATPVPLVAGDRVQLQQVLVNLLLNAMDALQDATPAARRITLQIQAAGPRVEVTVSDMGHGIPADKFANLFEPFFTTKAKGLGMGLSISRTIVEAHDGQLTAENNPAGGATFRFSLPVAET